MPVLLRALLVSATARLYNRLGASSISGAFAMGLRMLR